MCRVTIFSLLNYEVHFRDILYKEAVEKNDNQSTKENVLRF